MAEFKFSVPIGCDCPFEKTDCEFRQAYNKEVIYILAGKVDPNEFKLDNIIEEVKSWK